MFTTLWKFRLRCSSLHSVIRPKGELSSPYASEGPRGRRRAVTLAFGREQYGTHWCFLVHGNEKEAQGPPCGPDPKALVLDEPSQPLPLGHQLIVLAVWGSERVPSPRARQLCNMSPISICQGL